MSILEILTYPNPKLRQPTQTVTMFDAALEAFVQQMYATMYEDQGCGLAATQVGNAQRIFVMDISRDETNPICLINPEIVHQEGIVQSDEGCLSFPGIYAQVKRAKAVTVRFKTEKGVDQELALEGLGSHCVQHELDHLNGILFVDWLSKLKRERLLKKLLKLQRTEAS